jgi:hypothetical protein
MKLYKGKHLGKRRLKKRLGYWLFKALNKYSKLKVGDVLTTCEGVNRKITNIHNEWEVVGRRTILTEFIFTTDDCTFHAVNCCQHPPESKQEIVARFKGWLNVPYEQDFWFLSIAEALDAGEDLFDDNGIPNSRYSEIKNKACNIKK